MSRFNLAVLVLLLAIAVSPARSQSPPIPELKVKQVAEQYGPTKWPQFAFGEPPLFSAAFPQAPQQMTHRASGSDGGLTLWMFLTGNQTTLFQLVWAEPEPTAKPKTKPQQLKDFNGFVAGYLNGLTKSGKIKEPKAGPDRVITLQGRSGLERDISFAEHESTVRFFFVGRSWLAAIVLWNSDAPELDRRAFFESVRLSAPQVVR